MGASLIACFIHYHVLHYSFGMSLLICTMKFFLFVFLMETKYPSVILFDIQLIEYI